MYISMGSLVVTKHTVDNWGVWAPWLQNVCRVSMYLLISFVVNLKLPYNLKSIFLKSKENIMRKEILTGLSFF